jgi:hypothetical protein
MIDTTRMRRLPALAAVAVLSTTLLAACGSSDTTLTPTAAGASPAVSTGASGNASSATESDTMSMPATPATASYQKQAALYAAMADLWEQHMEWTYATVVAFASGSPALTPTLNRLLRNQSDIGNAIKPFYGDQAGDQLTTLLKKHITDAVPVLTAAKKGDTAALNTAVAAWYANAKQIGDFLAAANPHWAKADMEQMLKSHITQTIAYATDALKGQNAQLIKDYGVAEQHMVEMANMLAEGLIQQFPAKFA